MAQHCYHCGVDCDDSINWNEKVFCCAGCQLVYQLLDENGLCQYYDLTDMPGMTAKGHFVSDKYNYLDNEAIQEQLIQFKVGDQAHVVFYLPQIHCVSCVWLLEHLNKINPGIIHSQTQFDKKEIKIVFNPSLISFKELVQLLAFVGYEPMIHLGGIDIINKKKVLIFLLFRILLVLMVSAFFNFPSKLYGINMLFVTIVDKPIDETTIIEIAAENPISLEKAYIVGIFTKGKSGKFIIAPW